MSPTYDYLCETCDHVVSIFRSISDTSTPVCPTCERDLNVRRYSTPALEFRGRGWGGKP
jgi:putative FmdB family regulatory protein